MRVAVKDANIFIDLELSEMLDAWFSLGIETHTSVFIREELEKGNHTHALQHFDAGSVTVHEFEFDEITLVHHIQTEVKRAANFNDCSVLYIAEKLGIPLLTGDGALRISAKKRGVEIHGTLWIFDLLVDEKKISTSEARQGLQTLLNLNRFLPKADCIERLHKWK